MPEMEKEKSVELTVEKMHEKFAVDCFNGTWDLLEKEGRTDEQTFEMIHMAHASLLHWIKIGTPKHRQTGEWMVANVYARLNLPESALHHAKECLRITETHDIGDFDLFFAYEAMARSSACAGNREDFAKYHELAEKSLPGIKKDEDREYSKSVLDKGPWYGMKPD